MIGYLSSGSPKGFATRLEAFRRGLQEIGYREGQNVAIEYRWAEGQNDRLAAMAADLVRRQVNVMATLGGINATTAAKAATATIPIVFEIGADPIASGLVTSLSRPDGNITGVTSLNVEVGPKRLELLHQLVPAATVFALLVNPTNPNSEPVTRDLQNAARTLKLELHILHASNERDFDGAFAKFAQLRAGGLVVGPDPIFISRSEQLAALTVRHGVNAARPRRRGDRMISLLSLPGLTRQSIFLRKVMDARVIGERSDAVLRTAMPPHDALGVSVPTIGRRDFITLLGGAAALAPLAARAQQPAMPVVGMLRSTRADGFANLTEALRAGLSQSGYDVGRNVAIEYRWADEQRDRLPALAAELIRKPVAMIVGNTQAALAAKAATTTVPIVFVTGTDPVRDGLVTSFNRPGGNVTGISFVSGESTGKRLELLRQLVPGAATIGVMIDPRTNEGVVERRDLEAAAKAVGQQLLVIEATADRDLEPAFASMIERKAGALLIGSGAFLTARQRQLAALALRHKLPTARNLRGFVEAGGLMSYGASITDAYRQAGLYVGRILKGEKPADLPVLQSSKFDFVINLATAKALGLAVPMHIHAAADEVIE